VIICTISTCYKHRVYPKLNRPGGAAYKKSLKAIEIVGLPVGNKKILLAL
jgi:hypothetical protein